MNKKGNRKHLAAKLHAYITEIKDVIFYDLCFCGALSLTLLFILYLIYGEGKHSFYILKNRLVTITIGEYDIIMNFLLPVCAFYGIGTLILNNNIENYNLIKDKYQTLIAIIGSVIATAIFFKAYITIE